MKKTATIILCLMLATLVACNSGQEGSAAVGEATVNTSHFEAYTYVTERIETLDVSGRVLGMWTQGERAYYCYRDLDSSGDAIFVASQNVDGQDVRHVALSHDGYGMVHGFRVSEDNAFELLLSEQIVSSSGYEFSAIYCRYDFDGRELSRVDITEMFPQMQNMPDILQAVITDDGNIVLAVYDARGIKLHLINTEAGAAHELQLNMQGHNNNALAVLRDGRCVVLDTEQGDAVLREIDFGAESFGETYPVEGSSSSNLFSVQGNAQGNAPYDLLVSNSDYLYGYNMESGEQTILLSWNEAGIDRNQILHMGVFDDGRIFVHTQTGDLVSAFETVFYVLAPILREEMPEQIIITLGGLNISRDVLNAVAKFNRENSHCQIQVEDYFETAGDNWQAGLDRLRIELMTGKGPDILSYGFDNYFANAPLLDLYTFIDADPELSRTDFFPNILHGLERADGTLPMLITSFSINTMIGMSQTVGHIDYWTPSAMIELGEEMSHIAYPFAVNRSKNQFFTIMLMYASADYINMETHEANFESESFIRLLEAAKFFPESIDPDLRPSIYEKYFRVLWGEQILAISNLFDVSEYHRVSQIMGDNLLAIGFPTAEGGQHTATPNDFFGISATTRHADEAWSFLRTLLLESTRVSQGFSLRVDKFEAAVDDAMTTRYAKDANGNYIYDDDGELIETVFYYLSTLDGESVEIREMTDVAERELRRIVSSARIDDISFSPELWSIIDEEISDFLNGVRSAEATARILQNRVQIYLSEQELVG